MTIKKIYLRDFRNYAEAMVDFSPGINVLVGENAQGKTNLLEAIGLLMTGRSFRTQHLSELIRFGTSSFYIEALFEKNGVEQTLKFSFNGNERKIIHNATSLPCLSTLLGLLMGVILSPEDRSLVKGGPHTRRHFLDLLLAQATPLYLHHLSRYLKALKQRNVLLRRHLVDAIYPWEEHMALSATFLTRMRSQTIEELERLSETETFSTERLNLNYRSSAMTAVGLDEQALHAYYLKQFEKNRNRECDLGMTLTGPHRDDMTIFLQGKEARQFASEGQQRSCVAALKLAQWKWLETLTEAKPSLCIDEIGVSFDASREEELYQRMQHLGQVFVTTVRPSSSFPCHSILIKNGNFLI
jgi:DNA replication and repair protein RecF